MTEQYNNMVKKVGQLRCENDRYKHYSRVEEEQWNVLVPYRQWRASSEVSLKVVLQYT